MQRIPPSAPSYTQRATQALSPTSMMPRANWDLIRAAKTGDTRHLVALLNRGADVNAVQETGSPSELGMRPLLWAARQGHSAAVNTLLKQPALQFNAISRYGGSALMEAAKNGHVSIVESLLQYDNAIVNVTDAEGKTALMAAIQGGSLAAVLVLLKCQGIDLNQQNHIDRTALFDAVNNENVDMVRVLLNAGADVNVQDHRLTSVLHCAVIRSHADFSKKPAIVDILVNTAGIALDAADCYGETALQMAVEAGDLKVVKSLIEAGSDPSKVGGRLSLQQLSLRHGHLHIAQYLSRV